MNNNIIPCSYGCGKEATHQFKNGKWCCSDLPQRCSESRRKTGIKSKTHRLTEESKKKISQNNPRWSCQRLCFTNHLKKCIICGENKIVEVHHYDNNHKNDSPENLIPMCPTHHQYFHSKYKYLVEDKILKYIKERKEK